MAESLITRFGGSSSDPNTHKLKWVLCTEIITENKEWTVPLNIRNGEVSVRIFGGGGGYGNGASVNVSIARFAAGGAADTSNSIYGKGGLGICIIQYYI